MAPQRSAWPWIACGGVCAWSTITLCNSLLYGTPTFPMVGFVQENVLGDVGSLYGVHPALWYVRVFWGQQRPW